MSKAVLCTVKTPSDAARIVTLLESAGFTRDDVSMLMPNDNATSDFEIDNQTKAPEGAIVGAGTGAAVGGALGWLAGIGALAIPGLGPFIAAGPIMAALAGATVVGTTGALAGALVGMGIPEYEAKHFEGKLKGGHILLSVHADNKAKADRAKEIFREAGGQDISTSSEPDRSCAC
jgi:hypothetical protein